MADDIVERLRKFEFLSTVGKENPNLYRDAADEIERLRLELDMSQATIRVPSQKDDVRTIERLREELKDVLDEAARLRKDVKTAIMGDSAELKDAKKEIERLREALKPFAELVDKPVNIYEHNGVQLALIKFDDLSRLCRAAKAALEGK